jgi:hypothetical protein
VFNVYMSTTTNHPSPKEAQVMYSVYCPCGNGEVVVAHDEGFHATEVQVDGCSTCKSNGIIGRGMRKSWAYANGVVESGGFRHSDGLVTMTGAA